MSGEGDVGRWMRRLQPCFLAQFYDKRILFTHADVPIDAGSHSKIREFTREFAKHMSTDTAVFGGTQIKYGDRQLIRGDTIFWERRFEELGQNEVDGLVEELGVDYLVVGHTPHERITSFFGKIFDIDVGMTPRYGEGEPAAIVFNRDGVRGFYADGGETRIDE
ncbi:hypothetical protein CMO92_03610 [Candidatus Woesearchaeota archaeon]|nr:hypothetical protein [Candidatus Woesearchaeota archaeon]